MAEAWKQWEGQVVGGGFHLRKYLGGSDHSAVFLIEHGEPEPQRVVKFIPEDPKYAETQLSQWQEAAQLSHPHLIHVFRSGRCQVDDIRLLYVVMEFAEEDLSQVLPHRALAPTESREMLNHALDALAYIHRKGFLHGHIKPANILAVGDQVKVSSDGICGVARSRGRPGPYDPPEIEVSPAADVWSLGMTVVEALTQRLPVWQGTEEKEPILPGTLPEPFLNIARHCLRREPQCRCTLSDIAVYLERPTFSFSKMTAQLMRERPYLVIGVAAGLGLVAILQGPRVLNRHQEKQPPPANAFGQSQLQPISKPSPVKAETGQPAQMTSRMRKGPNGAVPLLPSSRLNAETNRSPDVAPEAVVVQQVLPDVPQKARDTIQGRVRVGVRVSVDPSGDVMDATLESPGPSRYFANLALQAARRWKFVRAEGRRQDFSRTWVLRFEFERTSTKVHLVQRAPPQGTTSQ